MEIFNTFGQELELKWRDANYDEAVFPALASDALRQSDLPSKVTAWEVLAWALGETELPLQRDLGAKFGDPPVTVFSGPRFHIDLYFWFEGTTAIHQHSFCGAFQVLLGSSIHSWYEFERRRSINMFTEIGDMNLKVCELLEVGAVQAINPGRAYIHSLFHLDHPSATIVIRTDRSPLNMPQFSYEKPFLAIDPFFEQPTTTKKLQVIGALYRAKREDADSLVESWLAECDLQTSYHILSQARHHLGSNGLGKMFGVERDNTRFERLLDIVERRHGDAGRALRPVFERYDTLEEIVRRRNLVTDTEHRFFLALLLNIESRAPILDIIKTRFPNSEPLNKILDWTYDLANTRIAGDEKVTALGIADFGDIDLYVFEQMLNGRSGDEIASAFLADHGTPTAEHALAQKESRIREAIIFRPLFA